MVKIFVNISLMEASKISKTVFSIARGKRNFPATLKLTLGTDIKEKLLHDIKSWNYGYISNGDVNVNKTSLGDRKVIDLSKNDELLLRMQSEIVYRKYKLPAEFILQWADSDGVLISNKNERKEFIIVVSSICQHEIFNAQTAVFGREDRSIGGLYQSFCKMQEDFFDVML